VAATTGAAALEAGIAVDLTGVGDCVVLDTVGVSDTVGVPAPVGEAAGLVAVGFGAIAVTMGDAWPSAGAVA
jgi:hypothetical protein